MKKTLILPILLLSGAMFVADITASRRPRLQPLRIIQPEKVPVVLKALRLGETPSELIEGHAFTPETVRVAQRQLVQETESVREARRMELEQEEDQKKCEQKEAARRRLEQREATQPGVYGRERAVCAQVAYSVDVGEIERDYRDRVVSAMKAVKNQPVKRGFLDFQPQQMDAARRRMIVMDDAALRRRLAKGAARRRRIVMDDAALRRRRKYKIGAAISGGIVVIGLIVGFAWYKLWPRKLL